MQTRAYKRFVLLFSGFLVVGLALACFAWVRKEQRQYTLNRQLIDVLKHGDTHTALALVNTGADPNTRLAPLPVPTYQFLFNQLLHRQNVPVNNSPTAFILAAGVRGITTRYLANSSVDLDQDLTLLEAMLVHGANMNARCENKDTALHGAVFMNRPATVELLLKHGADVNAQDARGVTPLVVSVGDATVTMSRLLLAHGADPNAQNQQGETVLALMVDSPQAKALLPDLMAHGANPNLHDKYGGTPLLMAQTLNRPDIVALMQPEYKRP